MTLSTHQAGALLRLTLDRPDKRNAFDEAMIAQLTAAFERAATDRSVGVLLLQATGAYFSAGGDLAWMQRMASFTEAENLADARRLAAMLSAIDLCPKPVIARVQGSAFAGAVGMLACCDLVVAVPEAEFAITEVRIGLLPAVISPYLVRAMGQRQARRWCLTAERFSAAIAHEIGLVHAVVDAAELDDFIERQVDLLQAASPHAITATKALLAAVDRPLDAAVIDDTAERIARQRASADGREGVSAFLEKRRPIWTEIR